MPNPVQPASPQTMEDYLFSFEGGMDSGSSPLLLGPNVYAYGTNTTNRGDFLSNRPVFQDRQMVYDSPATQTTFELGRFQGGCYASPDRTAANPAELLVAAYNGRLLVFRPAGNIVSVFDCTIAGNANPSTQTQAWLWQAENYVIWNDGLSAPVFLNLNTLVAVRSNYAGIAGFSTTISTAFTTPAPGSSITLAVASNANMVVNDVLVIANVGRFKVNGLPGAGQVAGVFSAEVAQGVTGIVGALVNWNHNNFNLPPGRMGAYVLGRNWMSLTDGKQFIASDLVGGASGTAANNYRDSVLNITENTFLIGGGNFSVPGNVGDIAAIIGLPTIDAALGQGPVLVVTPKAAYSCQSPVDRLTWTSVQNPILTQVMLTNAGLGQPSTVTANSDVIMRAPEGVRSLILTRNDFQTWGNTTMSYELLRVITKDNRTLLPWATATVFDNRYLISLGPIAGPTGVYHRGIAALNFDPHSTLGGKQPSVWEGVWLGIFPMQFATGYFSAVERLFCFSFNPTTLKNELNEILSDDTNQINDNGTERIAYTFESPVLFKDQDPRQRKFKQLSNGEIYVDDLIGTVDFYVFYRPDFYPGWIPWFAWSECQSPPTGEANTADFKPGYRPRMGLGEPSAKPCDPCGNRSFRLGFNFQVKIEIVGHCTFRGARFEAIEMPKPKYAPLGCTPICA